MQVVKKYKIMRYELEKYKGPSTRHTCPSCGKEKTFTRYIDLDSGRYIDENCGICNRAINCGYHCPPRNIINNGRGELNSPKIDWAQASGAPTIPIPINKKIHTIPKEYLERSIGQGSNFVLFLKKHFEQNEINQAILNYKLGMTKNKEIIYWQIDKENRIRTGKIMQYDAETGKRVKSEKLEVKGSQQINTSTTKPITWVHTILKKQGKLEGDWKLTQCLFGEHLLCSDMTCHVHKTIALVESEKTAIIASIYMPEIIWLASGGLQNFNAERCRVLKGEKVVVFADLGATELWKKKALKIEKEVGCRFVISEFFEKIASPQQKEQGLDIADYLLENL